MKKTIVFTVLLIMAVTAFNVSAASESGLENLVKGAKYAITPGDPVEYSYLRYPDEETDVDSGQLTDSTVASDASYSDPAWYRALRGGSRIVGFDLGSVCAISAVKGGFLQDKAAGIYAPRYLRLYLSDDGEKYALVFDHKTFADLTDPGPKRVEAGFGLEKPYAARYVRVEFCCDINCYCDEIEILGYRTLKGDEPGVPGPYEPEPVGYPESVAGIKNIIKIYNGYYGPEPDIGKVTKEMLLPYIAYVDEKGEIADTMFDCVAFVPCHGTYPSGGRLAKTNGFPGAVMSDWELYFDMTFDGVHDLAALDITVGEVYAKLGKTGKFAVLLTMPYPTVLDDPFGDIDGDGKEEYCRTLEERSAILRWFADKCITAFCSAEYENLSLAGFYWYREEVNYSDSDHEDMLVAEFCEYARGRGFVTLFDPFYLSVGYDHWRDLGFDAAVMQPNAAFSGSRGYFDIRMLGEFAYTANSKGVGVEIETDEPHVFRDDTKYRSAGKNYESYLFYGYKTGYMNALKTYYQGAGPGTLYDFCYADTASEKGKYLRSLYDLTYRFIKGNYSNEPPKVSIDDFGVEPDSRRNAVAIEVEDGDSRPEDIRIDIKTEPEHGYAGVAAGNKELIYTPEKGFSGADSFVITVSDGFNEPVEKTVAVFVGAQKDDETSTAEEPGGKKAFPGALIAAFACAAAALAAVAAVLLKRRKKKA